MGGNHFETDFARPSSFPQVNLLREYQSRHAGVSGCLELRIRSAGGIYAFAAFFMACALD